MQYCAAPRLPGGLSNPVLVQEGLANLQAAVHSPSTASPGHAGVLELDFAVVGRHVECPPVVRHGEAFVSVGTRTR